jgi:hypothetical protein
MIWKEETPISGTPDWFRAKEIIIEAYLDKIINWNVYCQARKRIETVKNTYRFFPPTEESYYQKK